MARNAEHGALHCHSGSELDSNREDLIPPVLLNPNSNAKQWRHLLRVKNNNINVNAIYSVILQHSYALPIVVSHSEWQLHTFYPWNADIPQF